MTGATSRYCRMIAALVVAAGMSIPAAAQNRSVFPVSQWSERGMFALGGLNFDFFYQRWAAGPTGGRLRDCSSKTTYCLDGPPFRLAIPRDCAVIERASVGQNWVEGSVRTEILYIEKSQLPPLHGMGRSDTTYYVGDPATPSIIYEYDRNVGLTRILQDEQGGLNFADMARNGKISQWLYGSSTDRQKANKVHNITTFDRFGACGSVTPLAKLNIPRN